MSYPKKGLYTKKAHEKAFKSGNKNKTQSYKHKKSHKDKEKFFFVVVADYKKNENMKKKKIAMGIFTKRTHNGHKL